MNWMILLLKIVLGIVLLVVLGLGAFFYAANKSAKKKSLMIDELAKVPIGSTVDEVMQYAGRIGINFESEEFAIPSVLEILSEDLVKNKNDLPEKVTKATDLSNFKNGKLNFGLSLFLFERKGCEILFKEGRVTATRVWWLD